MTQQVGSLLFQYCHQANIIISFTEIVFSPQSVGNTLFVIFVLNIPTMVFVVYRYYESYYKRIILITEGNKSQRKEVVLM